MASPKLSQIHNFQRGWAQIFNHLLRNGLCDSVVVRRLTAAKRPSGLFAGSAQMRRFLSWPVLNYENIEVPLPSVIFENMTPKTLNEIGGVIIGAAFDVRNDLGTKFVEEIYQEAMIIELTNRGLHAEGQHFFDVYYKGRKLNFRPKCDILVENEIIVELKAVPYLKYKHLSQLISYLAAGDKRLGYLINFHAPEFKVAQSRHTYADNLGIYRYVNQLY